MSRVNCFVKAFQVAKILLVFSLACVVNAFASSPIQVYQAESATVVGARVVGSYVDYINPSGDSIEWNVNVPSSGAHDLDFMYSLTTGNRPLEIKVNGVVVASRLNMPYTGSWSVYKPARVSANLKLGVNNVRATAIGYSGPNMDALFVRKTSEVIDPGPGPVTPPTGRPFMVAYVPNWRTPSSMSQQLQYSKLTHLNIAFENPNASGDLSWHASNDTLVSAAHANNVKVLVSLGGATTATNSALRSAYTNNIATPALRAAFVEKILNYLTLHKLDGVDIDIEGPAIKGVGRYGEFIVDLSNKLKPQKKLVTSALSVGYGGADVPTYALAYFDFINIMSYDATGSWSAPGQHAPMSQATQNISYWKGRGVPGSRLVLGVPFYGRGWGAYANTGWPFSKIVAQFPGSENFNSVGSGSSIIYYNGIPLIKEKCKLVGSSGLAGMMFWSMESDAVGAKSLLSAMHSALNP